MGEWKAVTLALNPDLMERVREYSRNHQDEYPRYSKIVNEAIEEWLEKKEGK